MDYFIILDEGTLWALKFIIVDIQAASKNL